MNAKIIIRTYTGYEKCSVLKKVQLYIKPIEYVCEKRKVAELIKL